MTPFPTERDVLGAEILDGVAVLTLRRPETMNSVSPELARALAETLAEVPQDGSVRAILLTGTGRAFCAGGDIRAMSTALEEGPRQFFLDLSDSLHRITRSLIRS